MIKDENKTNIPNKKKTYTLAFHAIYGTPKVAQFAIAESVFHAEQN